MCKITEDFVTAQRICSAARGTSNLAGEEYQLRRFDFFEQISVMLFALHEHEAESKAKLIEVYLDFKLRYSSLCSCLIS